MIFFPETQKFSWLLIHTISLASSYSSCVLSPTGEHFCPLSVNNNYFVSPDLTPPLEKNFWVFLQSRGSFVISTPICTLWTWDREKVLLDFLLSSQELVSNSLHVDPYHVVYESSPKITVRVICWSTLKHMNLRTPERNGIIKGKREKPYEK